MTKVSYEKWSSVNTKALKYVHNTLIKICNYYGIQLINDKDSYNCYLKMMYNESSKVLLDPELYQF
jgi:hypothetical protein